MDAKLIKTEVNYILENDKGVVIASTSLNKEGLSLSLKNCQAIERGYDLDELVDEFIGCPEDMRTLSEDWRINSFKSGFQKALELMKDSSLKPDPKLINSMCMRYRHDFGLIKDENIKKSLRTTMTQLWEEVVGIGFYEGQTEWDVEIEMIGPLVYPANLPKKGEERPAYRPKLDADGCLILKRI